MPRCKQCQQTFDTDDNAPDACRFHSGKRKADLAVFNSVRRVPRTPDAAAIILDGIDDDGPWWYWTCCNAGDDDPGCEIGPHRAE